MMGITIIMLIIFLLTGLIYIRVQDKFDRSAVSKNMDLTLDGLFKALGIGTICIAVMTMFTPESQTDFAEEIPFVVEASSLESIDESEKSESDESTNLIENMTSSSEYKDGVFTGIGKGFKGNVTVEVEVEAGQVTRVEVIDHRDDRKWFNRANGTVPQSIIENQSADVDTVSGATYTSLGIIDGAREALEKSKGE